MTSALQLLISTVVTCLGGTWKPTQPLVDFADLLGWSHDGTFEGIFKAGQASMPRDGTGQMRKIRAMGQEDDDPFTPEMKRIGRQMLDEHFGQAGNETIFSTSLAHHHCWLFLSNWPADALPRAECMARRLSLGYTTEEIVLLASINRPGPPERGLAALQASGRLAQYGISPEDSEALPVTEMDSLLWLLQRVIPANLLEGVKITEVPAAMITLPDGRTTSPNTRSSLVDWRKTFGGSTQPTGDVLAFSNGWQWPRGRIIVQTELDSWGGFGSIETVGAPPGFDYSFAVRLAEFNRFLYEVRDILNKFGG